MPFQQLEQITSELASEKANSQKFEAENAQLERQSKDLKTKVADLELQLKTRSKAIISEMERKIATLQEQLDSESK